MAVSCFGRDAAGAGSAESRSPAGLKRSIRYAFGGIRLGCFSNDDGSVVGRTAVPEQASVGHANSIRRFAFHHFMQSLIRENRAACGAISSPRCSESKASWTTRSMIDSQNRRTGWQTLRRMAGSQPVGGGLPKASASWPGCGLASHGLRRVSRARNGQIIDLAIPRMPAGAASAFVVPDPAPGEATGRLWQRITLEDIRCPSRR
jgi:hypothetical protein